jgi:hypothetical protein
MTSFQVLAIMASCLVVTRFAYAQNRGLAVLVGPSDGDPIVLKISDELRALGFEVEVAPHGSDHARIRRRANQDDALAVVLVDAREIEVHVVTSEQVHKRRLSRRADDLGTDALAAVEVVRGYLVPVGRSPKDVAAIPPVAPAPPDNEPRALFARLTVGLMSAGSYPIQDTVTLGGAMHFGRLAIELAGVATAPRADAWSGGVAVGLQFAPLGVTRPISFSVGIGALGLAVAYREDGKKYTTEAVVVPDACVAVRAAISESVFVRVDAMFGVPIPSLTFKSKTGSDIQFGSSVATASAGIEVAW